MCVEPKSWLRGQVAGHPTCTVEPPNKGHVGDNINSAVLSFIERLSSCRGPQCIKPIGKISFRTLSNVFYREVYYACSVPILKGLLLDFPL